MTLLMVMFFVVIMIAGYTLSALSSSKTATGVISITMPASSGLTSESLYYDSNNDVMYLRKDVLNNVAITADTKELSKLVLVDAQGNAGAYIKIELSILGMNDALTYNASGSAPAFSDGVTMSATTNNGVITFVSGTSSTPAMVSEYSYIYLDKIISKIKNNGTLNESTLQVKIISSLDSGFASSSSNVVYYSINTEGLAGIALPTGANYTAQVIQTPTIGGEFKFKITATDKYLPEVRLTTAGGTQTLTATSSSGNVYNYLISNAQGTETVAINMIAPLTITYYDDDGTTQLYKETLKYNTNSTYSVVPTKASDGTYDYTFSKWVTTKGNANTEANRNNVTQNMTVYAYYDQVKNMFASFIIDDVDTNSDEYTRALYYAGMQGWVANSSNETLPTMNLKILTNCTMEIIIKFDDMPNNDLMSSDFTSGEYEFKHDETLKSQGIITYKCSNTINANHSISINDLMNHYTPYNDTRFRGNYNITFKVTIGGVTKSAIMKGSYEVAPWIE